MARQRTYNNRKGTKTTEGVLIEPRRGMPQTVQRAETDVFGDAAWRKKVKGKNLALYKSETA